MIFASFEFLLLFLPGFLLAYFLAPAGWRNAVILLFSWAFYAWWRLDFLALLLGVTLWSFLLARRIAATEAPRARRRWLLVALGGPLGALLWFKYANFGVESLNAALAAWGAAPLAWTAVLLPIGLSFYVLQSVSYVVDVWRRAVPPSRDILSYAAYTAMFSQLIAGPIIRYAEVRDQLGQRAHSLAGFGLGARRFMMGFAMKVLVADSLAPLADAAFALPQPTTAEAWAGLLAYTLQIFFDFAGYSAMAIGLAAMCGFRFPENFRHPYLAGDIRGFWQRWHMTLSRFLRDYLYIPLGGSRHGPGRTRRNLVLTMAIGGAWHGANWTFLAWGLWHGALLALHRAWRETGRGPLPWLAGHPLLLLAVMLGWVLFRAEDFSHAGRVYAALLGATPGGITDALAWEVTPEQWGWLGLGVLLVYLPLLPAPAWQGVGGLLRLLWPVPAFLAAVALLHARAAVPFLYFQF